MKRYCNIGGKKLVHSPLMNCEIVASHQKVSWTKPVVAAPAAVAVVAVVEHSVLYSGCC